MLNKYFEESQKNVIKARFKVFFPSERNVEYIHLSKFQLKVGKIAIKIECLN